MAYTLGERIKEKRLELGMSQQQLGDLFDPKVKRASISRWESNVSNPEIDKLPILARKFKTTIDYLIMGDISKSKTTSIDNEENNLFPKFFEVLNKIRELSFEKKINRAQLDDIDEIISSNANLIINRLFVNASKKDDEAQKTA